MRNSRHLLVRKLVIYAHTGVLLNTAFLYGRLWVISQMESFTTRNHDLQGERDIKSTPAHVDNHQHDKWGSLLRVFHELQGLSPWAWTSAACQFKEKRGKAKAVFIRFAELHFSGPTERHWSVSLMGNDQLVYDAHEGWNWKPQKRMAWKLTQCNLLPASTTAQFHVYRLPYLLFSNFADRVTSNGSVLQGDLPSLALPRFSFLSGTPQSYCTYIQYISFVGRPAFQAPWIKSPDSLFRIGNSFLVFKGQWPPINTSQEYGLGYVGLIWTCLWKREKTWWSRWFFKH